MSRIQIGLCGFSMSMAAYARSFSVVEIQQTFYQPPSDAVLVKWRRLFPAPFEFTLKAWQLVTHAQTSGTYRRLKRPLTAEERQGLGGFRDSAIVEEGWQRTRACAVLLQATAILFQCPASFGPTAENIARLERFFTRIDRPSNVRLLWEPRGAWPGEGVERLCRTLDLVHVVDPFVNSPLTRDPLYLRLHGVDGARHVFTDAELLRLQSMLPRSGDAYVMFNNIPRVEDARRFQALLEAPAPR